MDSIAAAIEQQAQQVMQQQQQQQQLRDNHQYNEQRQHLHQAQQQQLNEPRMDLLNTLVQSVNSDNNSGSGVIGTSSDVANGSLEAELQQFTVNGNGISHENSNAINQQNSNLLDNLYASGISGHMRQQVNHQQINQQQFINGNKRSILPRDRSRSATGTSTITATMIPLSASSKDFTIDPNLNIGVGVIPDIIGPRLNLGNTSDSSSNGNGLLLSAIPRIPTHPSHQASNLSKLATAANNSNNMNNGNSFNGNHVILECTRCKKPFTHNLSGSSTVKPFKLCPHCRDLQRERSRKWQQRTKQKQGACRRCGVQIPTSQSQFVLCPPCRLSLRSRKASRYEDGKCVHCSGENLQSEFKVCLRCRNNDRLRRKGLEEKGCCNRCSRELQEADVGHKVCLRCRERKKKKVNDRASGNSKTGNITEQQLSVVDVDVAVENVPSDFSIDISSKASARESQTQAQSLSDVIGSFQTQENSLSRSVQEEDSAAAVAQRVSSFEASLSHQQKMHQQQAQAMVQAAALAQRQQQQQQQQTQLRLSTTAMNQLPLLANQDLINGTVGSQQDTRNNDENDTNMFD